MQLFKKNKYTILKTILKYSFVVVLVASLFLPAVFTKADNTTPIKVETKIENPLNPKLSDIPSFIEAILEIVLIVGIPIVALSIIYSGFLFVQASGNTEKLGKAKQALLASVIGAALLLGAWVLAEAIKTTVDDIKSGTT